MTSLHNCLIFIILVFMATTACAKDQIHRGGPYYYASFTSYEIPFRPIEQLTHKQAQSRDSYYVAYYDNLGKIVSFTKYLYKKVEFTDKYIYDLNGKPKRRELTNSKNEVLIQYFDEKGNLKDEP